MSDKTKQTKIRSDQIRESRYFQGGRCDITPNTIEWWESYDFKRSPTDIEIVITPKYAKRPDLLAHDAYGKSWLDWFVLQYNNIVDLNEEFVEGCTLVLPTRQRLFAELLIRPASSSPNIGQR